MENNGRKNRPIFIISSPRSGSTLLRLVLNAHSKIAIPPPTLLFPYIFPYSHTYGDLQVEKNLDVLIDDILELQKSKPWPIELDSAILKDAIEERSFAGIYAALHRIWAEHHDKPRWGEKTPPDIFFIGDILACFPDAQFIHIIRDGRDVAVDWMENLAWPKNIYSTAVNWKDFVGAAAPWRDKLDSDQLLEIYYESFVRDPQKITEEICSFLGEAFEPEMLQYYKSDETAKWSKSDSCHRFVSQPITDDYVGIFKDRLKIKDRQMLATLIGAELKDLGYPVEDVPREIGIEEEGRYKLDGRVAETWMLPFKKRLLEGMKLRKQKGVWSDAE